MIHQQNCGYSLVFSGPGSALMLLLHVFCPVRFVYVYISFKYLIYFHVHRACNSYV